MGRCLLQLVEVLQDSFRPILRSIAGRKSSSACLQSSSVLCIVQQYQETRRRTTTCACTLRLHVFSKTRPGVCCVCLKKNPVCVARIIQLCIVIFVRWVYLLNYLNLFFFFFFEVSMRSFFPKVSINFKKFACFPHWSLKCVRFGVEQLKPMHVRVCACVCVRARARVRVCMRGVRRCENWKPRYDPRARLLFCFPLKVL